MTVKSRIGPEPEIDPKKSFMQNVMEFAGKSEPRVNTVLIAAALDITPDILSPRRLQQHPLANHQTMTRKQAEEVIALVVPPALHDAFRTLKGYPEAMMDEMLEVLLTKPLIAPDLQILKGKTFGALVQFNLAQKQRDGRYLTYTDCARPDVSASSISALINGRMKFRQTKGFRLLDALSYEASVTGFEDFCRETADIYKRYERRKEKFGPALFITLYPDGIITSGGVPGMAKDLTQQTINQALGYQNNNWTHNVFYNAYAPTDAEIEVLLPVMRMSTEEEFYRKTGEAITRCPDFKMPVAKVVVTEELSRLTKNVRVELGVEQSTLDLYLRKKNPDVFEGPLTIRGAFIRMLEKRKIRTDLSPERQDALAHALGCSSMHEFREIATQIEAVQRFRDAHLVTSLRTLIESGVVVSGEIKIALSNRRHETNPRFTPVRAREILSELGITEVQLYQNTQVAMTPATLEAYADVTRFLEKADLKRFEEYESGAIANSRVGKRDKRPPMHRREQNGAGRG